MVKITDDYLTNKTDFEKAGIKVPTYNQQTVTDKTLANPRWIHFGGGNLFRAFHAAIADKLIEEGEMDTGVIVGETYDDGVIDSVYKEYNNRIVRVITHIDGNFEKQLFASVAGAYYVSPNNDQDWDTMVSFFTKPSLQVVSFSITEKGYSLYDVNGNLTKVVAEDIQNGPAKPKHNMPGLVSLLLARYNAGQLPIALVSTDNFSQNGDKLKNSVITIANGWVKKGYIEQSFVDYLNDPAKVSFPISMIDRITPNPSESVGAELKKSGYEDSTIIHTPKHTNIASFTNTEETHYLVIEDHFPNGRPAFEKAGVIMTDRDTVNKADEMKVTTCLNPLHTALAIYGTILGFDSIAHEMEDEDLVGLIKQIGYVEGLPVVADPKVIDPKQFIDELVNKRLPNPYIPDKPQRIAADTSQKIPVRYGVTISHYVANPDLNPADLTFIPLVIATWARYLMGINDNNESFTPSPDPLWDDLHAMVSDIKIGEPTDVHAHLKDLLTNTEIFGQDLYAVGLGEKVEDFFTQEIAGTGTIRTVLHDTLTKYAKNVD